MKKFLALVIVLLFVGVAWADQRMTVNLETWEHETGTTTSFQPASSTSPLYLHIGSNSQLRADAQTLRVPNGGYWVMQLRDISINGDVAYHTNYSGDTYELYYKASLFNDTDHWELAEKIPLRLNFALSGATKEMVWFKPPPAEFMRFYFTSGLSGFDISSWKLMMGEDDGVWEPPQPIVISQQSIVCSWNSGASTLTVPDGTRYVEIYPSGGSVFYTVTGTSPTQSHQRIDSVTSGNYMTYAVLSKDEAKRAQFGFAENVVTVTAIYLTGKPVR